MRRDLMTRDEHFDAAVRGEEKVARNAARGGPDIALDVWVAEQQEDSCGHTLDIQEEFLSGEFMGGQAGEEDAQRVEEVHLLIQYCPANSF